MGATAGAGVGAGVASVIWDFMIGISTAEREDRTIGCGSRGDCSDENSNITMTDLADREISYAFGVVRIARVVTFVCYVLFCEEGNVPWFVGHHCSTRHEESWSCREGDMGVDDDANLIGISLEERGGEEGRG